ncbi:MAG: EAL domain-containing protein [Thiomicrospira sp.]|uniref:putative bifunctional diguanylate cyclase/phosphodiesterase n=1 Tax=Thiomicrospira sp. TaxID=935 RepID=UPI0019E0BC98|nr:EAL domain-containing protein [Thiomicrospira sp.]MBE0493089.1 EAL domain-containing protein [Thiomicrospira sp.]
MSKTTKNTTFYIALGYALICSLALVTSLLAFGFDNRIQQSIAKLDSQFQQKELVEKLYQNARDRSILLLQMVTAKEPFELDHYQMQLYDRAEKIMIALQKYQALETNDDEKRLFNQLLSETTMNRELQNRVMSLIVNQQADIALELLVLETLPVQENAIQLFQTLYSIKDQQLKQSRKNVDQDVSAIKKLWVFTLVSFFILITLISAYTLKKLHHAQRIQHNFQAELEQKVQERTKEIVLDSAILQNIHESIAIATEQGRLVKTNIKYNALVKPFDLDQHLDIWTLLPQLFADIDIECLFSDVIQEGYARQEGALKSDQNQHYLIDVHQIEDIRLDNTYLSFLLTDVTDLKQTQKELENLANYDLITELPNRNLFQKTVKHWIKQDNNQSFGLFFLDLDNFKWVNDTQGHEAGDQVLKQVAQIIRNHLPDDKNQMVARLGGDEFAIICRRCDELALAKLANQLIDAIKQLYQTNNQSQTLGCSIGIVTYPKDGNSLEDLMRHADFSMYKAKEQGKNGYCLFSDKMNEHIHYLYQTEINLHHALLNREFFVVYQPQYQLDTLEVTGAEALIRWQKGGQLIPPSEFIPLAEKFGLINAIGGFVLESALAQLKTWQQSSNPLKRVAINVSSAQLNEKGFTQHVKQQLDINNLQPNQLDLEITESLLLNHLSEDNQALSILQKKGLEISIDDFGTGYSSLAYIKHLNVDRIKIDQSFVRDLTYNSESYSIVTAIITMGHSLGLKVLAEGIETMQQLALLRELGCDEGQGYLLSYPHPADQVSFKQLDFGRLESATVENNYGGI